MGNGGIEDSWIMKNSGWNRIEKLIDCKTETINNSPAVTMKWAIRTSTKQIIEQQP